MCQAELMIKYGNIEFFYKALIITARDINSRERWRYEKKYE